MLILAILLFWKLDNSSVITRQNVKVALAVPVLQCKNPAVEGRGSLSSSFRLSGLAQGERYGKQRVWRVIPIVAFDCAFEES